MAWRARVGTLPNPEKHDNCDSKYPSDTHCGTPFRLSVKLPQSGRTARMLGSGTPLLFVALLFRQPYGGDVPLGDIGGPMIGDAESVADNVRYVGHRVAEERVG